MSGPDLPQRVCAEPAGSVVRSCSSWRSGFPIPSLAVVARIGDRFRDAVRRLADTEHIPVVRFAKHARKLDVMRPHFGSAGRDRSVGDRRNRCGAGVSVGRLLQQQAGPWSGCSAFPVGSGGAAGVVLLLLSLG